jgi:hypothetical protein
MLKATFDTLWSEGATNGRVLVLHLHPWLIGQPFRIGALDAALGHVRRHREVWTATGSEIIEWYRRHGAGAGG